MEDVLSNEASSDASDSASDRSSPTATVGFLFVHGIGNHKVGDELLRYAEPMIKWAGLWCSFRGIGPVAIEEARLRPRDDGPAFVQARIATRQGTGIGWLLTEAHWADAFPSPAASAVLLWAARFAIRVVRRLVSHLLRPVSVLADRSSAAASKARGAVETEGEWTVEGTASGAEAAVAGLALLQIAVWLVVLAVLVFAYVWIPLSLYVVAVAALACAAIVAVWVLAALLVVGLKVPGLGSRLAPLALGLSTSMGDSYTLLARPVLAAAMLDRIAGSLEWLSQRADHVIVVAHSQGAALATRSLFHDARLESVEVEALVTVGGAVALLRGEHRTPVADWQSTRPDMRWLNLWAGWDPVSAGPLVDSDRDIAERWDQLFRAEAATATDPDPADSTPVATLAPPMPPSQSVPGQVVSAALGGVGAAYGAMAAAAVRVIPKYDPKPPRLVAGPSEFPVHNRASLLRDHSGYADNYLQVLHRLAVLSSDVAGYNDIWMSDDAAAWAAEAEYRHVTAVRLLGASRIVSFATAVLVAGYLQMRVLRTEAFDAVLSVTTAINSRSAEWLAKIPAGNVRELVSFLVLASLCFCIGQWVVNSAWSAWRTRLDPGKTASLPAALMFGAPIAALIGLSAVAGAQLARYTGDAPATVAFIVVLTLSAQMLWAGYGIRPRPLDSTFATG